MEMTDSDQLKPAPRIGEVSLLPAPGRSWVIKPLHDRVAAADDWSSLTWSAEQWRRRLTNPRVRYATIMVAGQVAGLVEFESQPQAEVEITMFGLTPEYCDHGLSAHAFSLATRIAWTLPDAHGKLPRRVWLHTSGSVLADDECLERGFTPVCAA
jgi:hypothetical protein